MGNCILKVDENDPSTTLTKQQFTYLYPIGKGGFGKVWKVTHRKLRQQLAMKEMSKARIVSKRSVNSVMNERRILAMVRHPLVVNMHYALQDKHNLYLVMDLKSGGDLRYHISRKKTFTEAQCKFLIACLISSLDYLHTNNIIHRDIKPENLVLDNRGYLHITDFGIARIWQPENAHETSGTPGYMAPEVLCRNNHGFAVDYFAVGVIAYELMMGRRPYTGRTRKEIRDSILAKQVQLSRTEIPGGWSPEAVDFINKLIQRKPNNRLGVNGPKEVKEHVWLRDFPWSRLLEKKLETPFSPLNGDNFDSRHVRNEWKDEAALAGISEASYSNLFQGYFFDGNQNIIFKSRPTVVDK